MTFAPFYDAFGPNAAAWSSMKYIKIFKPHQLFSWLDYYVSWGVNKRINYLIGDQPALRASLQVPHHQLPHI